MFSFELLMDFLRDVFLAPKIVLRMVGTLHFLLCVHCFVLLLMIDLRFSMHDRLIYAARILCAVLLPGWRQVIPCLLNPPDCQILTDT